MMFRNVQEEEEESGSDWDDLTPHQSPQHQQPSPQHSPQPHSPPSQPHPPNTHTQPAQLHPPSSQPHPPSSQHHTPTSPSHPPTLQPYPHTSQAHTLTSQLDSSSSRAHPPPSQYHPPTLHTSQTSAPPANTSHKSKDHAHQPKHKSKRRRHHEELELTPLSEAPPPQPHPPPTPPITNPAYTMLTSHSPPSTSPLLPHTPPSTTPPLTTPPFTTPPHHSPHPPPPAEDMVQEHAEHRAHQRGLIQFDPVVELGGVMVEKEQEYEEAVMARVADRSEKLVRRCYREFFSTLRLISDLLITFLLECAHCLAFHVIHKLCCGLLFTVASALGKPALADCYNACLWPLALCCLQVCRAVRMVVSPCVECVGWAVGQCVRVASACRLVEITRSPTYHHSHPSHLHMSPSPSHPPIHIA